MDVVGRRCQLSLPACPVPVGACPLILIKVGHRGCRWMQGQVLKPGKKSNTGRLEVIKAAAERRRQRNYERTGMLFLDVLPDEPIPAGSYLVHNHVRPQKPLNGNGFRA